VANLDMSTKLSKSKSLLKRTSEELLYVNANNRIIVEKLDEILAYINRPTLFTRFLYWLNIKSENTGHWL